MLEDATRREQRDLELLRRVHDHTDPHAREELVRRFMPLVRSIARKYRSSGEPFEDIVQAGSVGLVKAIDRFDFRSGTRFVSFATPNIQGEIRRHFRDHTWAVHVPRAMQELRQRVRQHQRAVLTRTGRSPTVEQVAQAMGERRERVAEAITAGEAYSALSLDQSAVEGRSTQEPTGGPDPGYALVDDRLMVQQAWRVLDDRMRRVFFERFYEGRLQREIADEIGVSQMQVSRLLSQGLDQMRTYLDDAGAHRPAA
jgi:RNA polymerase sigma-B factor